MSGLPDAEIMAKQIFLDICPEICFEKFKTVPKFVGMSNKENKDMFEANVYVSRRRALAEAMARMCGGESREIGRAHV